MEAPGIEPGSTEQLDLDIKESEQLVFLMKSIEFFNLV